MAGKISFKMLVMGVIFMLVVFVFAYGYVHSKGLRFKLDKEGFFEQQEIVQDWNKFEKPDWTGHEIIDCYVGVIEGKKIYKKYPVKLCPSNLDKISQSRIVYEAFLIANSGKYGGLAYTVENVYARDCENCLTVSLTDGHRRLLVSMEGLLNK